jgi:hypothetical protein
MDAQVLKPTGRVGAGWWALLWPPPGGGGTLTGSVVGTGTFGVFELELTGGGAPPADEDDRGAAGAVELVRGAGCGPLPAEVDERCEPGAGDDFDEPGLLPGVRDDGPR